MLQGQQHLLKLPDIIRLIVAFEHFVEAEIPLQFDDGVCHGFGA